MPQPTLTDVHVNVPLSTMSVAYLQNASDYIADQVFPIVSSTKPSNIFFVYNRGDFYRDEAGQRADGTESRGTGYGLSQSTYNCLLYALHKDIGPQVRAASDTPLDADRDATIFLTQRLAISRERQFMTKYFATGKWTGSTTGSDITPSTKWDATSGSTPIEDIETQQFHVKQVSGLWPNVFVLGANVYKAIKNSAELTDRVKYTQRGVITTDIMASILAPPNAPESATPSFKVLVASAVYNSAAEGATDSITWTATATDALLAYAAPNPGIQTPSAGYIFTWVPIAGYIAQIKQIPMPWLGTDAKGTPTTRIEGEMSYDMNLVAADLGVYFSAATA